MPHQESEVTGQATALNSEIGEFKESVYWSRNLQGNHSQGRKT